MNARACFLALLAPLLPVQAIDITLVYQNPSDPLFNSAAAQQTMQKAAADVSYAITTTLSGLSQDVYSGTNGVTSATVNWSLSYTNPLDGASVVSLPTFSFLPNEIVLYVGSRSIAGSTLGLGGAGGAGFGLSASGAPSQWAGAVDSMEAASNTGMARGGPLLNTISGSAALGGTNANYDLNLGYTLGSLAINSSATWNLAYDQLPGAGQNDLYSVAVHEMIHAIGFGVGQTWNENVNGTSWDGEAVIALLGSGTNVLSAGGDHIVEGLLGKPLIDGVWRTDLSQEAVMSPSIVQGTRKYITDLDLAFLRDMGWQTQIIPEPTAVLLVLTSCAILVSRRRRPADRAVS